MGWLGNQEKSRCFWSQWRNRSVVSRASTKLKARGCLNLWAWMFLGWIMNLLGALGLVYSSWKQLLCIQMQDFMQALKKRYFPHLVKPLDIKNVDTSHALIWGRHSWKRETKILLLMDAHIVEGSVVFQAQEESEGPAGDTGGTGNPRKGKCLLMVSNKLSWFYNSASNFLFCHCQIGLLIVSQTFGDIVASILEREIMISTSFNSIFLSLVHRARLKQVFLYCKIFFYFVIDALATKNSLNRGRK